LVNLFVIMFQIELSIVYKTDRSTSDVSKASVFMPVEIARRAVNNNISSSSSSSSDKDVAVCVQATFGNLDRRRLVEWFEMQRLLGVWSIGVYSTPLTHADTHKTLSQYGRTPLVQHRTIDYLDVNGRGHLLTVNLAAINDCFYRHLHTHRFIAVLDFDEVYFAFVYASRLNLRNNVIIL